MFSWLVWRKARTEPLVTLKWPLRLQAPVVSFGLRRHYGLTCAVHGQFSLVLTQVWLFCLGGIHNMGILNYFDIRLWFVPYQHDPESRQGDWWSWALTCPRERRSRWSGASQVNFVLFQAAPRDLAEVGACRIWHSAKSGTHHGCQFCLTSWTWLNGTSETLTRGVAEMGMHPK